MKHLERGLLVLALAFGAISAQAGDGDRKALEEAKKKASATLKVKHLLPLLESTDEAVKKEAEQIIQAQPQDDRMRALVDQMRNNESETLRAIAARHLEGIKVEDCTKALTRSVLVDNIEGVRKAALETLAKNVDQTELLHIFYSALFLHDKIARVRAAEAIGVEGANNPAAVETLIQELWITWGATQRVNVFFGSQIAYVKAYDIEIAQQAVIAKPIVGTVSSGVALDTTVLRVQEHLIVIERHVIGEALKNLTGQDFGEDAAKWEKWWQAHKDDWASK